MKYPMLTELPTSKDYIEEFGGLNRNLRIQPNEFADICNLTTDEYPVLSTRGERGKRESGFWDAETLLSIVGVADNHDYCYMQAAEGNKGYNFFADGVGIDVVEDMEYGTDVTRDIIQMGANMIMLPDMKYVNTSKVDTFYNHKFEYVYEDTTLYRKTRDTVIDQNLKYYELKRWFEVVETPEENPASADYYVFDGKYYKSTSDYTVQSGVTYYTYNHKVVEVENPKGNPKENGYLVRFFKSLHTSVASGVTYYIPPQSLLQGDEFIAVTSPEGSPRENGYYEAIELDEDKVKGPGNNVFELLNERIVYYMDGGIKYFSREKWFAEHGDLKWSETIEDTAIVFMVNEDGFPVFASYSFDSENGPYLDDFSDEEREKIQGGVDGQYAQDNATGLIYYWIPTTRMWMEATGYIGIRYQWMSKYDDYFSNIHEGDGIKITGFDPSDKEILNLLKSVFSASDDNPLGILTEPVRVKKITTDEYFNRTLLLDVKTERLISTDVNSLGEPFVVIESPLTYENYIPKMDFVVENKNRLWGCRYGLNDKGEFVNEIYASKLGDFRSWGSFSGVSTDSYMVSVGSDGPFTGAVSYLGKPMFFKENHIHTIYGEYPAQYQMMNTECKGVQEGCSRSIANVNGVLYYKSIGGVSAYTGSMPVDVGGALNNKQYKYSNAVGCAFDGKYCLAMSDEKPENFGEKNNLYLFDTEKGVWYMEDNTNAAQMCTTTYDNKEAMLILSYYKLDEDGKPRYRIMEYSRLEDSLVSRVEKTVEWYAETGDMGLSSNQKKYISKIDIRMALAVKSEARIYVQYDSSGNWEKVGTLTNTDLAVVSLPIKIKRCDHFRIRIEGKGQAKIYSLSKTIREGSAK